MDKDEALKLALEALDCICSPLHVREITKVGNAMKAIKETLSQPEQESDDLTIAYMSGFHDGKNKDAPQPKPEQEFFVVKHYSADERPTIKGNGFDGLEVGTDREDAEEFIRWVNARISTPPQRKPEQEPVAWRSWNDKDTFGFWDTKAEAESWCDLDFDSEPLYTTPPPQREWVGLTKEEIDRLNYVRVDGCSCSFCEIEGLEEFAKAIEAKLRDKNT